MHVSFMFLLTMSLDFCQCNLQSVKLGLDVLSFVLLLQPLFYIKVPDGRERVWSRLQRRRWTPGWCLGIAPS